MKPSSRQGIPERRQRAEQPTLWLSALVLASLALSGLAAAAPAPTGKNARIVGVWEVVKSDYKVPGGATVEFTKAGELKMTFRIDGRTITAAGTYKIEGNQIKTVMCVGEEAILETVTIKSLTEKKLVTVDAEGKEDEFRKK